MKAFLYSFVCFCMGFVACSKNETPTPRFEPGTQEHINQWVLDSMQRYYYWSSHLPVNPNYQQATDVFFQSLRHTSDRFSFIVLPGETSTRPQTLRSLYGFDYAVVKHAAQNKVYGVVQLVLKDSPAERAGLQRGKLITHINGTLLTEQNAEELSEKLVQSRSFHIQVSEWENGAATTGKKTTLSAGFSFDQALEHKILTHQGKTIAYLHFAHFNKGMHALFGEVFQQFTAEHAQELVLDLRYNSGGDVQSAAALCALIAPDISQSSPFIIYKGNANGDTVKQSFGEALALNNPQFNFNSFLENKMQVSRVYVLSTEATASASELVINNLRPYLEVVQIGETTLGKDVASFEIKDKRTPKQIDWVMYPVVYKLSNAKDNGNYDSGIAPQIQKSEFAAFPDQGLFPLGNPNEILLASALNHITGTTTFKSKEMSYPVTILLNTNLQKANVQPMVLQKIGN